MKLYNSADLVDVIDVTLFKYNHYDNLIWTKCLNQVDYNRVSEDEILVTPYQLETLFELNFEKDIRRIKSINFELVHKDASSLFFLHKILEDFRRLKWIKITLSKRRNFSRMVEDFENSSRQIKYSYKILHSTVRLNEFLDLEMITSLNSFFKKAGILTSDRPYSNIKANNLVLSTEALLNDDDLSDVQVEALAVILDFIDSKMQGDDPEIMFVTEWWYIQESANFLDEKTTQPIFKLW